VTFILNVSQPNKNLARYYHKFTYVVMSDLNENWTFSTDFSKNHKYKVNNNPSSGRIVVSYSRTVGQSGMTRLTAAFRTLAKAQTNCGIKICSFAWLITTWRVLKIQITLVPILFFVFHIRRVISSPAERMLPSREGLCTVKFFRFAFLRYASYDLYKKTQSKTR